MSNEASRPGLMMVRETTFGTMPAEPIMRVARLDGNPPEPAQEIAHRGVDLGDMVEILNPFGDEAQPGVSLLVNGVARYRIAVVSNGIISARLERLPPLLRKRRLAPSPAPADPRRKAARKAQRAARKIQRAHR